MEEKLNYKQPAPNRVEGIEIKEKNDHFPVHADWAYFKDQGYPEDILFSAISLDQSSAENGPIHVWPSSHLKYLEHERVDIGLQVKQGLIDFNGGENVLAPPGSVMICHALLIHNSRANAMQRPRRLMIYSHYPSRMNMGSDVRNGPTRVQERKYEERYRDMVAGDEYTPTSFLDGEQA